MDQSPMRATPSPSEVFYNPVEFAVRLLKIQDKRMNVIPLRYNAIQRDYLSKRTPRDLILKPRQVGFSTLIQAEFRRYEWTRATSTLTLGKDDNNTTELRRIADHYYHNLPAGFRPQRQFANASLTSYPGLGSQAVIATAGSRNTGRGGTRTHVHGSEVAFWPDAQAIMAGALQGGDIQWVALESTPNGASGWFYERCMEALEGRGVWRLHFYRWFDEPAYRHPEPIEPLSLTDDEARLREAHGLSDGQILWRRAKILEIGPTEEFLQEYPEDVYSCFMRSGAGYFGTLDTVYSAPMHPTPDLAHQYVAGLDFGQQQDYTALVVIDVEKRVQVDLLHINRQSWADMRAAIRDVCQRWNVALLTAENNAMGSTNIEALRAEFDAHGVDTPIAGFDMTPASKPPLMASLRTALHETGLKLQPHEILRHELSAAVSKQTPRGWTVESPRDERGHGDTVVALALAWHGAALGRRWEFK